VMNHGQLAVCKGYGKRDLASAALVDTNTIFAIGSVSKQFTCVAILLLAEDGRLSVEDKVAQYYPKLTSADDIRLIDLMRHVSGYTDYYPLDFVDSRMQKTIAPDDLIQQYAGGTLDFPPRSNYSYSNTGYIILGRIVEKISGLSLGEFLQRRIFGPLGMQHTVYEPRETGSGFATGYRSFALGDPEPTASEGLGWLGGAGAIRSTAGDLAKWDLALAEGTLLKPASWKLMTSPFTLKDGRNSEYGCGVSVSQRNGYTTVNHTGAVSGFMAGNALIPSTRSAVVVLSNCEQPLGDLRAQLFGLLTTQTSHVPDVAGKPATEVAQEVFFQFQTGKLDRSQLGAEFSQFVTDEKLRMASQKLKPLGKVVSAKLGDRNERGGMEVTTVRLEFKKGSCGILMYRLPKGEIEEFLILP